VAVLREVKYLILRGTESIPASASSLYEQNDTLLSYVANLDLTVAWYNKIRQTVLEVEYPIIEQQLKSIDTLLYRAEHEINWNNNG
jgi:dynein heavy chain, axonemal